MSVYDLFNIRGRKALITGAARGIGKVLAIALAEAGCDVAVMDLTADSLGPVAGEIEALGVKSLTLSGDVSSKKDVDAAFTAAAKAFGKLDICMNNAGISIQKPAEEMPEADYLKIIDINLKGVFLCCQAAARLMIPQKSGSIINMGSMSASAVNVPQKQAIYNTSKAGVVMLTRSLAVEWAPYGVRVNSLSPGYMKTEMTLAGMSHLFPTWESLTPMGRLGVPEELRGAVLFMASDASSYMTGNDMIVDGGYTSR